MEALVLVALVVSFALLVTAHVALSAGIATRDPWWRGALALLVPPLAPVFGFREKLRVRSALWALALAAYLGARIAAWHLAP